jgi:transposase
LEEWTTIKYLKAQALGTRMIPRQLGISRNTVRRALGWDRQLKYERQPRMSSGLDPFENTIRQMVTVDHFIGGY